MGATLSSVPLCSRADPATDDNNNVDNLTDNNLDVEEVNQNVIVAQQPAPVETSTPKIDRERYISRTRQINVYNIYIFKQVAYKKFRIFYSWLVSYGWYWLGSLENYS